MPIRPLVAVDTDAFIALLLALDAETPWLMFEPGERPVERDALERRLADQDPEAGTLLGAFTADDAVEDERALVGFLGGQRRAGRRNRHAMSLVLAVRETHCGQGYARRLLDAAEAFARAHDVSRLELCVVRENERARHVYEAAGFVYEGIRREAVRRDEAWYDELYMARLLRR